MATTSREQSRSLGHLLHCDDGGERVDGTYSQSDASALLEKAVRLARATHDNVQPVLTIGHSPYVDPKLISCILSVQLPLYPNLRLRMESMFALDLAQPSENPLLTNVEIATAPLCVAMPVDHPAARNRSVSVRELGDVGWMIFPRKSHPAVYERVLEAGYAGISAVELHHYLSPLEVVQLITENFGIAFAERAERAECVQVCGVHREPR